MKTLDTDPWMPQKEPSRLPLVDSCDAKKEYKEEALTKFIDYRGVGNFDYFYNDKNGFVKINCNWAKLFWNNEKLCKKVRRKRPMVVKIENGCIYLKNKKIKLNRDNMILFEGFNCLKDLFKVYRSLDKVINREFYALAQLCLYKRKLSVELYRLIKSFLI